MTDLDELPGLEIDGIYLSLPPEWDASTPERLRQVRDDLLAAADGGLPAFEPLLSRFFEFAGQRADLLIAWLLMPLTTEQDDVRGLLFASLVAGVVEDVQPWPPETSTVTLGPWTVARRQSQVREALDEENILDVLVLQYDVSISGTRRFVCEFRSPNLFLADALAHHFDEIVSGIRLVQRP